MFVLICINGSFLLTVNEKVHDNKLCQTLFCICK